MATISDALVLKLKADTDHLKKGLLAAQSALEGLKKAASDAKDSVKKTAEALEETSEALEETEKDGKESTSTFKNFTSGVGKLKDGLIALRGVLLLVAGGFGLLQMVKANVQLGNLSKTTGQNVKSLKSLQMTFEQAGYSAEEASQSVLSLEDAIGKAKFTGEFDGLNYLNNLGVTVTNASGGFKKAEEILLEAGESARRMTKTRQEAMQLLMQFGWSRAQADVYTRDNIREEIENNKKLLLGLEKQVEVSEKANNVLTKIGQTISHVSNSILLALEPAIDSLSASVDSFFQTGGTQSTIINTMKALGDSAKVASGVVTGLVDALKGAFGIIEKIGERLDPILDKGFKWLEKQLTGDENDVIIGRVPDLKDNRTAEEIVNDNYVMKELRENGYATSSLTPYGKVLWAKEQNEKAPPQEEVIKEKSISNPPTRDISEKQAHLTKLEQKYGLPAGLLDSIWLQESSRGKNKGKSKAGAEGDFQFMPETAIEYGVNVKDFYSSADGAARKLKNLIKYYKGNVRHAVGAYNFGEGNLNKWLKRGGDISRLNKETRNYMANVMSRLPSGMSGAYSQMSYAQPVMNRTTNHNTTNHITANVTVKDAKEATTVITGLNATNARFSKGTK